MTGATETIDKMTAIFTPPTYDAYPNPELQAVFANIQTAFITLSNSVMGINSGIVPCTYDPHVVGMLWNNAGVLTISAG